jgi:NADH:ubiquinone oxidoreductase subunit B-like Fe-S oxidoreductase
MEELIIKFNSITISGPLEVEILQCPPVPRETMREVKRQQKRIQAQEDLERQKRQQERRERVQAQIQSDDKSTRRGDDWRKSADRKTKSDSGDRRRP